YNISSEPADNPPAVVTRAAMPLAFYEACTMGCARCGRACAFDRLDVQYTQWLQRRYAIGMRRTASGKLRLGDGCVPVAGAGNPAAIGDCTTAPTWQLDGRGTLRSSTGLCLEVIVTGEIIAGMCGNGGPGGRFFLDDEGHLWSSTAPAPQDDMALAHLY